MREDGVELEKHFFEPLVGVMRDRAEKARVTWDDRQYEIRMGAGLEDPESVTVIIRVDDDKSPADIYKLTADGRILKVCVDDLAIKVDKEEAIRVTGIIASQRKQNNSGIDEIEKIA